MKKKIKPQKVVIFEQPMRNFDLETCPTYEKDTVYCGASWHPELSDMLQEREKVMISTGTYISYMISYVM